MMRLTLTFHSFILFLSLVKSDELCGLEPPKAGETCSGSTSAETEAGEEKIYKYDYEEKPMTQEEADVWARRFYAKAS